MVYRGRLTLTTQPITAPTPVIAAIFALDQKRTPDRAQKREQVCTLMPVGIFTGTITGRKTTIQLLLLPAAIMALAAAIGVVTRLS